jgi:hypothetical protein
VSQQINLYNPAFEYKRDLLSLQGAVVAWSLAIAVVVLSLAFVGVRIGGLESTLAQLESERDATQADMTRLAAQLANRKPAPELAAEVQRLEVALSSRKAVMSSLGSGATGVTRFLSEYLAAFTRQSVNGLSLTGLRISNAGEDVVLEGRAQRPELVPEYLQRLNREEVMRGHAFADLEMRRPGFAGQTAHEQYIEFRLSTLPARRTNAKGAQ